MHFFTFINFFRIILHYVRLITQLHLYIGPVALFFIFPRSLVPFQAWWQRTGLASPTSNYLGFLFHCLYLPSESLAPKFGGMFKFSLPSFSMFLFSFLSSPNVPIFFSLRYISRFQTLFLSPW